MRVEEGWGIQEAIISGLHEQRSPEERAKWVLHCITLPEKNEQRMCYAPFEQWLYAHSKDYSGFGAQRFVKEHKMAQVLNNVSLDSENYDLLMTMHGIGLWHREQEHW